MAAEAIIELRSVSARSGSYEVLGELSFSVAEGESAVFMGAAGSGKSSLLKAAAGILIPAEGEVLYRGRPLSQFSRREELEFRKRSGFAFQDAALWANQSIFDNLALPYRLHEPGATKSAVEAAVRRAAELVGYGQDLLARPSELSSGERKLIGLARALVLDPELLFMDEPAANLDEESADRVLELLSGLRARKRSLLVVSSSSELAFRIADRIGVIRDGRLLAYGSYGDMAARGDPAIRGITGRLRPRREAAAPSRVGGLVGAWADALAADTEGRDSRPRTSPCPKPEREGSPSPAAPEGEEDWLGHPGGGGPVAPDGETETGEGR